MKILFVCKHNRFRSKVAKAFFNKLNKNYKNKSYSAGIFKGFPVHKNVIRIGKEFEIKISKKTNGLKEEMLRDYDLIVIVANNVPKELFEDKRRKRKVVVWKIKDTNQNDKYSIRKITNEIGNKVNELIKELK